MAHDSEMIYLCARALHAQVIAQILCTYQNGNYFGQEERFNCVCVRVPITRTAKQTHETFSLVPKITHTNVMNDNDGEWLALQFKSKLEFSNLILCMTAL